MSVFIRRGIVQCLFRNKITVDGENIKYNPNTTDLYNGWLLRDEDRRENFATQIFDERRAKYNRDIDRLLFDDVAHAVKRYDPDKAKPRFRELVRNNSSPGGMLWNDISSLPGDVSYKYQNICVEKEFFTTVDLWSLIRDIADRDQSAYNILLTQGYINQQAIADSMAAGISGSDWGHSYRPEPQGGDSSQLAMIQAKTLEEVFERAEFSLPGPGLELLALLSPEDVIALREYADNRIFDVALPDEVTPDRLKDAADNAIKDYWAFVCNFVYNRYSKSARDKTNLFVFLDNKIGKYLRNIRRQSWANQLVDFTVTTGFRSAEKSVSLKTGVPIPAEKLWQLTRPARYRILYRPNEKYQALEGMQHSWNPRGAWVSAADPADVPAIEMSR